MCMSRTVTTRASSNSFAVFPAFKINSLIIFTLASAAAAEAKLEEVVAAGEMKTC